ncbi:MAG: hypothetical protein DYG88_10920 [Chloroflexi bacterium CFX4]|nr:hypothetical protein [Chloroflexi bacterium CFX4]MDL1923392.1 hypothetical protein [Chloroflexi bacterium CFX3]
MPEDTPLVCKPNAIPASQQAHYAYLRQQLFAEGQAIQPLADGYRFRLPADAETLVRAAEFISLERLCCPFLSFRLEVTPEAVWLALTSFQAAHSAEVKALLRLEMGLSV